MSTAANVLFQYVFAFIFAVLLAIFNSPRMVAKTYTTEINWLN